MKKTIQFFPILTSLLVLATGHPFANTKMLADTIFENKILEKMSQRLGGKADDDDYGELLMLPGTVLDQTFFKDEDEDPPTTPRNVHLPLLKQFR